MICIRLHIHCDHCDLLLWQEFEFQGCQLQGPAADLLKAGASGRHLNNVKRDWFRKMGDMNYDHRVPWFFLASFSATYFPKKNAKWRKYPLWISFETLTCHRRKAPIQWVNVPLWNYGEDGWDDSPQLLGIRRLTYVHYLVYFLWLGCHIFFSWAWGGSPD